MTAGQKARGKYIMANYDENNCCHDNFDQNFGNFDDNYDKKY